MQSSVLKTPILVLLAVILATATIEAADPSANLFNLNKASLAFQAPQDCSGSLTLEAQIACASKEADRAPDGLELDVHVGTAFTQRLYGPGSRLVWSAVPEETESIPRTFSLSGAGFSVIHRQSGKLRIYASEADAPAAAALAGYLFDDGRELAFNKQCLIDVSSDAGSIAFKNCIPMQGEKQSTFKTAQTAPLTYDGYFTFDGKAVPTGTVASNLGNCNDVRFKNYPVATKQVYSDFGPRNGGQHKGLDFAVTEGTKVHAVLAGSVLDIVIGDRYNGGYGVFVKILHGSCIKDGKKKFLITQYNHLQGPAPNLKTGMTVTAGQWIATSGNTGHSQGPHLHFGTALVDAPQSGPSTDSDSNTVLDPKLNLVTAVLPPAGSLATAPRQELDFASEGPITTDVKKGETGILAITPSTGGACGVPSAAFEKDKPQALTPSICVYFSLSEGDAAAAQDIAFAGYSERVGGQFTVRTAFSTVAAVQYPEGYDKRVHIGSPLRVSNNPVGIVYAVALPVEKIGDAYPQGVHLKMYLRTEPITSSTEVSTDGGAPGIKRKKVGERLVGILKGYTKKVPKALEGKKFVLDAGHGLPYSQGEGSFNGPTDSQSSVHERDITLAVTRKLQANLQARGAIVTMTRNDPNDVSLDRRAALANAEKPNAFVSIHVNCDRVKALKEMAEIGAPFSNFPQDQTFRVCSGGVIYPDTGDSRAQQSKALAQSIAKSMGLVGLLKGHGEGTYPDGSKSAFVGSYVTGIAYRPTTLSVLRNTQMTAVLVEMGPIDQSGIDSNIRQQELADQIAEGLTETYGKTLATSLSAEGPVACEKVVDVASINRRYLPVINQYITKYTQQLDYGGLPSVPWQYVCKIIQDESSFSPAIQSPAGATGLMQLMPGTAQGLQSRYGKRAGYQCGCSDRITGIQENICCGIAYLREGVKQYNGDLLATAARYNGGDGGAAAYIKSGGKQFVWADYQDRYATYHYVENVRKFLAQQGIQTGMAAAGTGTTG